MAENAMREIVLVTVTDRADFGKKLAREAFSNRQAAEAWGVAECEAQLGKADDPDYCDPVADYETVWFTLESGQ